MSFKRKLHKLADDLLIVIILWFLVFFAVTLCSCASSQAKPKSEPVKPGYDEWAEVDKTFCDEVDACLATYKECKKTKPDKECFPPHEACVIKAYRKWKKARGK